MKRLKKCILLLFLFIIPNLYAQLNNFIIGCYSYKNYEYNSNIISNSIAPWDINLSSFLQTIKNYNFNTMYFETNETGFRQVSLDMLNEASTVGLRSLFQTKPLYSCKDNQNSQLPFNLQDANITLDLYDNANLLGYNIIDEPSTSDLYSIPNYANVIKEHNNSLLRWVNLRCIWDEFGTDNNYRNNYLQKYIDTSKPNILSFDQYPLEHVSGNLKHTNFFKALYDMALKSVENSVPFIFVTTPLDNIESATTVTNVTNYTYLSAKSIAKFNYTIYAALAYGAKGIAYGPGFEWVELNGYPFKLHYDLGTLDSLKLLHGKLTSSSISNELLSLNFASAYHKSFVNTIGATNTSGSILNEQIHDFCSWNNLGDDKYAQQVFEYPSTPYDIITGSDAYYDPLVISFLTNNQGKVYFWLFNKSLSNSLNFYMVGKANVVGFRDVLNDITYQTTRPYIELAPGEAKLFTTTSSTINPINYTINNNKVYDGVNSISGEDHFYPFESANQITLNNVTFASNSTKSFMANQIVINPGVAINQGSTVRLSAYKDCNTFSTTSAPSEVPHKKGVDNQKILLVEPQLYPNPTHDNFMVNTNLEENEKINIAIYDNMGKSIKVVQSVSQETSISLQNQPAGIYLVRFTRKDKTYNYKVVKL